MDRFKPGDRVVCVRADNATDISHGFYYTVIEYKANYWGLPLETIRIKDDVGVESEYMADRFELVRPAEQVEVTAANNSNKYACINEIVTEIHASNLKAGWWNEAGNPLVVPTKIVLTLTELSEAVEAHRTNSKDDKLPQYDGIAVELADAVIRIFDLAGFLGIPLGTIMAEKEAFNAKREDHKVENRAKPQGKRY